MKGDDWWIDVFIESDWLEQWEDQSASLFQVQRRGDAGWVTGVQ